MDPIGNHRWIRSHPVAAEDRLPPGWEVVTSKSTGKQWPKNTEIGMIREIGMADTLPETKIALQKWWLGWEGLVSGAMLALGSVFPHTF